MKKGSEIVDRPDKIRINSEDWKKTRQVVTENYVVWLQKGLDIVIKYLIEVFRGSLAMDCIPIPWRDARVVHIRLLRLTSQNYMISHWVVYYDVKYELNEVFMVFSNLFET